VVIGLFENVSVVESVHVVLVRDDGMVVDAVVTSSVQVVLVATDCVVLIERMLVMNLSTG
jgi:hypothetical protein